MSDDIGNIKLKITRSPSEASKRVYEPSDPSEVGIFIPKTLYDDLFLRMKTCSYQIIEICIHQESVLQKENSEKWTQQNPVSSQVQVFRMEAQM